MNLNDHNWTDFKISDIFPKIEYGKNSYAIDLEDGHDCIYVGAKKDENGFMKWCKRDASLLSKGNCIVFIVDGKGSVGYCNYMDRDFIATANLKLGYCKELNQYSGMFIATITSRERFRYSFGRKWKKFVKDTIISLPSTINNEGKCVPDWQFMEDYIKSLHYKPITTKNKGQTIDLKIQDWKEFYLKDMFDPVRGNRLTEEDRISGNIPFVTAGEFNEGVKSYISNPLIIAKDAITIDMFCNSFYHKGEFSFDDNIITLKEKMEFKLSHYSSIFISAIISQDAYRYQYGRQYRLKNFKNHKIKLPAVLNSETKEYEPDRQFMEVYIKSLRYGDRI